jgi:hypothetical protein
LLGDVLFGNKMLAVRSDPPTRVVDIYLVLITITRLISGATQLAEASCA